MEMIQEQNVVPEKKVIREQNVKQALYAAMAVGEAILEYGGEVSRVEDSIQRICSSYGFIRTDVFCITSTIISTAYTKNNEAFTQSCRITHIGNDFDKLGRVNDLSRIICREHTDPEKVLARLKEIEAIGTAPFPARMLIYALVPASFTVFFGGNLKDLIISGLIGSILFCLESRLKDARFNRLFSALLCSLAGGFLANILALWINGCNPALISIGNVMVFIPGVKFTNSIRDLMTGDTVTGLICLAESLIMAAAVALGFAAFSLLFI